MTEETRRSGARGARRRMVLLGTAVLVLASCSGGVESQLEEHDPGIGEGLAATTRPVILGRSHAVSSMKPEASFAAHDILRRGGNAFDAAVAAQAVLAVVDVALNGVGGDAMALLYDSSAKKVFSINATGTAPQLATIQWFEENEGGRIPDSEGLSAATTPGVVDAWYLILNGWGTLSFEEVLAPAIELAERGFPLGDRLAQWINESEKLRRYPSSVRVYYPQGRAPQAGEVFQSPDLAKTLKKIVEAERQHRHKGRREALREARDRFYKGDIAQAMAQFSEQNEGLLRYDDFAQYAAKVEEPVSTSYRGYRLFKNPSNNQGPAELIALNLLEGYDLKVMGHNSPDYVHTCVEAVKLAFADRDKYFGDMDFIFIPFAGLLSKEYAAMRRGEIDPHRASLEFRPGVAEKFMPGVELLERPSDFDLDQAGDHLDDTSFVCVVDRDRNVVSFTPSLHARFGTGVVMGDLGFILNCRADYFSLLPGHANALEPGRRPRTTLTSTLVLKEDRPVMALGSPGGDEQCQRIMQTFLNVVEFGMNVQQAIEAPRWSTRGFPSSTFPFTMYPGDLGLEERIPDSVRRALQQKGHRLRILGPWSSGHNAAIVIDPRTDVLSAGADPRVDAYAVAW